MYFKKYTFRFVFIFLSLIFFLAAFIVKLILIQFFRSTHLSNLAERQHHHSIAIEPIRGGIYDRQKRPLAFNVPVYSLYANPRRMTDESKIQAVEFLSSYLGLQKDFIRSRINRDKLFVWIKRKLDADVVKEIKKQKIKGLSFIRESKRFYPNRELLSHVIGFAGIDNQGLEGIELAYEKDLRGKSGKALIIRDARQRDLMIEKSYVSPVDGFNVILTIDETIQFITEKALDKAYKKHKALNAVAVVMDIRTGEILALSNRPTYDLSEFQNSEPENRTNRVVSHVFEPGSVFKIVAASAGLEEDAYVETDVIFCENGQYRIGGHILHDHKPNGDLSFEDVFVKSSNIGVAKIAQKVGERTLYDYAKRFRFGEKTGIDLKGEVRGIIRDPKYWSKTSISAIPMGHEVTVTPVQLVAAIGAVANKGIYMKPFVVKSVEDQSGNEIRVNQPEVIHRVISEETAERLKKILTQVVERGTAKRAQIDGISVAGKTGTAQKVIDGTYSFDHFWATFMGFAPADEPRLAAVVMVDDPQAGTHFGGTVAAPVFQEIVENSLRYLDIVEE